MQHFFFFVPISSRFTYIILLQACKTRGNELPFNAVAIKEKIRDTQLYNQTLNINTMISLTHIQICNNIIQSSLITYNNMFTRISYASSPTISVLNETHPSILETNKIFHKITQFFSNKMPQGIGKYLFPDTDPRHTHSNNSKLPAQHIFITSKYDYLHSQYLEQPTHILSTAQINLTCEQIIAYSRQPSTHINIDELILRTSTHIDILRALTEDFWKNLQINHLLFEHSVLLHLEQNPLGTKILNNYNHKNILSQILDVSTWNNRKTTQYLYITLHVPVVFDEWEIIHISPIPIHIHDKILILQINHTTILTNKSKSIMYTFPKTLQRQCVHSITSKYICPLDITQTEPDTCTKAIINSKLSHTSCDFQTSIPISNTTIGWAGQYELQQKDDALFLIPKDVNGLFHPYETIHAPPPILKTMHKNLTSKPSSTHIRTYIIIIAILTFSLVLLFIGTL